MCKALIVEDNENFRQTLKGLLSSRFSFIVLEEAEDAEQALEKIRSILPDLVFVDIKLPGQNGLELTKRIKACHPGMIIIILTSYDLPEYRDAAKAYGANHFLVKGLSTAEDILMVVESVFKNLGMIDEC